MFNGMRRIKSLLMSTLTLLSILTSAFGIQLIKTEPKATIKAVVLDSWGADCSVFTIYPWLNNEWSRYGSIQIVIDYMSLNKEDITYRDIALTEADVLIISHAYPAPEHVFTDTEIADIKKYVEEGHGIIGTYGTLIPENNRKLAELFGMNQSIGYIFYPMGEVSTGIFNILDTTRPLFVSLPNPFSVPTVSETIYVPSHDWTVEGVTDGTIVALTTDNEAAIITRVTTYKSVYFTNEMEEKEGRMPETSIQVFYNAIVWAGTPLALPLQSVIDIEPNTLNLKSKGKWITCYIKLPEGYNVSDINASTILLNNTFSIDSDAPMSIGDYDNDGVPDLMVKFDRAYVIDYIIGALGAMYGNVTLTVTGELNDGTPFIGSDVIRVISPVNLDHTKTVNWDGEPKDCSKGGGLVLIEVAINNTALDLENATIIMEVHDENDNLIGRAMIHGSIPADMNVFTPGLTVPEWASTGSATVSINAYIDYPWINGLPYCPEISTTFTIKNE